MLADLDAPERNLVDLWEDSRMLADAGSMLCLAALVSILLAGRALRAFVQLGRLLRITGHPHYRNTHWTTFSVAQFLDAVDATLVAAMVVLFANVAVLAISIDEVTTISHQSRLSIHFYYVKNWARQHCFIALPRIHGSPNAANIVAVLLAAILRVLQLTQLDLARKVMMLACDGASVLQGELSGVVTRLKSIFPFMQGMHYYAHRFDLAAGVLSSCIALINAVALAGSPATFYAHSNMRIGGLEEVCLRGPAPAPAAWSCRMIACTGNGKRPRCIGVNDTHWPCRYNTSSMMLLQLCDTAAVSQLLRCAHVLSIKGACGARCQGRDADAQRLPSSCDRMRVQSDGLVPCIPMLQRWHLQCACTDVGDSPS